MLEIKNMIAGYGSKPVLTLPDMKVAKGEQCLITGNSGSGKTTLLYAIAGLNPVIAGEIIIEGTNIATLPESERDVFRGKHIGIIFQTLHLVKSLTVLGNLKLASYVAGLPFDEQKTSETLRQLGIADKKDAMPETLSQGQAQRVAIARAVLHNPSLILADEPTSSLDDESCEAVITLIKQVAKNTGATLIISTHDSRVKAHFSKVITVGGNS